MRLPKTLSLSILLLFATTGFAQIFTEVKKAVAADRADSDRFGWSVDISGDYAIVGSYGDDFAPFDPNMGSAYIFEKEGIADWTFVQKINNSDQDDYDRFGWSVAIDGDYAIVGAYGEDHNTVDGAPLPKAGSAYIFHRGGDGVWSEMQKLVPDDRAEDDEFGWSVDISGTTAIVGAHFEDHDAAGSNFLFNAGSVYIFDLSGGVWTQTQKIVGSDRAEDIVDPADPDLADQFGHSVAIDGDYLIVGAFGQDLNSGGGSPLSEAGAAYIFERSGGVWSEVEKITNSDREEQDQFGFSVAISNNFAAVGANEEDENEGGTGTLSNSGSVYFYERDMGGDWIENQKIVASDRGTGDRFGWDVNMEGDELVVGAARCNSDEEDMASLPDAGAGYAYEYDGAEWVEVNKMDASDRQTDDQLGISVGVSGGTIIMGAFLQDFDEDGLGEIADGGAAYLYSQLDCEPSSSSQTLTLCAGEEVIVGPYTHDETGIYVDVIVSVTGCDSTVTTDLTIIPAPTSTQEVEICFGYSYEIGGSSHTESGVYTDIITNESGCDSLVTTILTVSPENAVEQDITICWGDSFSIGASTYDEPGTYIDVLTSWALCDCTITTNLSVQLPVDNSISQDMNILMAGSDDADYQWIKCNPYELIVGTGANDQTYIAPTIGEYAVIVTEGVCSDTSSCVYVDALSIAQNQDKSFNLFPNPVRKGEFINLSYPGQFSGYIVDARGQLVQDIESILGPISISTTEFSPGVYFIHLQNAEGIESKRIVIQ